MPKMLPSIQFHAADIPVPLTGRRKLKAFIKQQFHSAGKPLGKLDYIFCSDRFLLDINLRFLQHDFLTDIITFPLHTPSEPVVGEIYISVERVRDNAGTLNLKEEEELLRVIFHGALHLLGYKDKNKAEQQKMRQHEDRWLKEYQTFHVEQ